MPRFHFNVHDGISLPDKEGSDHADIPAARRQAIRLAGDLLRDQGEIFWNGQEWEVEVTNEHGLILFGILFVATEAPVLQNSSSSGRRKKGT